MLSAFALLLLTACDPSSDGSTTGDTNNTGGGSNTSVHYTLDTTKGTATDDTQGLVWQNGDIGHGTREKAIAHCQTLDFAGITTWKLPTSAQSKVFHAGMNAQGDTPVQAFDGCMAEVTSDGYVRTKKGAETYGGKPGDSISFSGGANIRCVSNGS